jgi:hypothetical protein
VLSKSQRPRPRETTIITADSPFGSMLHDASGQAIYLFDAERAAPDPSATASVQKRGRQC